MATHTTPRPPGPPRQAPGRAGPARRPPGALLADRGDSASPRPPLADRAAPRRGADQMRARRSARPGPKDPAARMRAFGAPRHTRPITGPGTSAARPATYPAPGRTRPRRPRAPFILLLVGLLGGALVCLLFISTTLAEGSYRITNLQQQDTNLAKQEQLLTQQLAQASSPTQIAQEAEQFGMRPDPALQFINLKTGKIVSGKVSRADAEINVPGYTP